MLLTGYICHCYLRASGFQLCSWGGSGCTAGSGDTVTVAAVTWGQPVVGSDEAWGDREQLPSSSVNSAKFTPGCVPILLLFPMGNSERGIIGAPAVPGDMHIGY